MKRYLGRQVSQPSIEGVEWIRRGASSRELDEVVFERIACRRVARGEAQFASDGAQVRIDGARTDDQEFSNLAQARRACSYQLDKALHTLAS
jgi:hypothetical protein